MRESSVKIFKKLQWLPIDDIIRVNKLYLLHKTANGNCPDYFKNYVQFSKDKHHYKTRSADSQAMVIP